MQLDIEDKPVNFAGKVGLDRNVNLDMKLPWTLEGRTISSGEQADDRIALSVGGSIDRLEIDWGKILQQNLEKVLQKEILEGLEDIFK